MNWARMALVFALALLAGMGINSVLVRLDAQHREQLETVDQPSAVGDNRFYPKPRNIEIGDFITTMNGRPLRMADDEAIDLSDGIMRRAGAEDREGFVLYQAIEEDRERELAGHYFLKVGTNDYLRLKPDDE